MAPIVLMPSRSRLAAAIRAADAQRAQQHRDDLEACKVAMRCLQGCIDDPRLPVHDIIDVCHLFALMWNSRNLLRELSRSQEPQGCAGVVFELCEAVQRYWMPRMLLSARYFAAPAEIQ